MNQISQLPDGVSAAGLDFNYEQWTAGTVVTLCNVPWNNDYRDVVRFNNRQQLNDYLNGLQTPITKISNVSTAKVNQPVRLDIPFNVAYQYNYLRASNPGTPTGDSPRDYYYFITDVRMIAPDTTEIVVQLDVWQTFGYDVQFGNCYIERGHIGIANEKAFDSYGRDYLTIPEGIDVGSEYRIQATRGIQVMENHPSGYDVLVVSTVDFLADPGTVDNPQLVAAKGSTFQGMPSGANYYIFRGAEAFFSFVRDYADKPWILQGIISITAIPPLLRYYADHGYTYNNDVTQHFISEPPKMGGVTITHNVWPGWRDYLLNNSLPSRYKNLLKFLTYPYTVVEMTTWGGTPVILKPESWANDDANVIENAALVPPNQRITFTPQKYNSTGNSVIEQRSMYDPVANAYVNAGDGDDGGDYLDISTMIANFPTMAIVNNAAIEYMASNAHSIAYQHSSADWSQQRALASNQTSYDQSSQGIATTNELNRISRNADTGSTQLANNVAIQGAIVGGVNGIGQGAISGGMTGGPGGAAIGATMGAASAAMGAVNAGLQIGNNNQAWGIRNNAANASTAASTGNAGYVRDTNKALADWSARGDYSQSIAGINAKVQDVRLTQPTSVGQVGGEAFNLIHNKVELNIRFKIIDYSSIRVVGEYWLRYGYAVRQFAQLPASLMVMSKFTYWKLSETYIRAGGMPETFKQTIRGIFEKGVTVWANPDDIGNIDIADNEPLTGVTL